MLPPIAIVPPAAEDSLLLYAAWGCPYSHRVVAARAATGLQGHLPIVWMNDVKRESGWEIDGEEPLFGVRTMPEVYRHIDPNDGGRPSVPLLVEQSTRRIVSTVSRDMVRFISQGFGGIHETRYNLCPPRYQDRIDEITPWIHDAVTRGVYRVGLANEQEAYERECTALFAALDRLEARLTETPYLLGDVLTEADLFLFPTLARFDAIYAPLFRCSLKRIADYPALSMYQSRLFEEPLFAGSFHLDRAKRHYYLSVIHSPQGTVEFNPSGIIPL